MGFITKLFPEAVMSVFLFLTVVGGFLLVGQFLGLLFHNDTFK